LVTPPLTTNSGGALVFEVATSTAFAFGKGEAFNQTRLIA
jgi:hypothetical protein